ncbi:hypothetical protein ACJX0J_037562, partial [Zea mays]
NVIFTKINLDNLMIIERLTELQKCIAHTFTTWANQKLFDGFINHVYIIIIITVGLRMLGKWFGIASLWAMGIR